MQRRDRHALRRHEPPQRRRHAAQHFNSVSSFAEYAVVPESVAIPVRQDVPLEVAALVGCAVITGYGAVVHTAAVTPGSTVAVWGCGGIGLSIVQAACVRGAGQIVALDLADEKLAAAERLGATHVLDARVDDAAAAAREIIPAAPDYAFEAVGREESIRQAWDATRSGGTVVVVGMMPKGEHAHDRSVVVRLREDARGLPARVAPSAFS